MTNTVKILASFASLNGAKFVGIRNYTNSKDEVSNQVLNIGVDVMKAKRFDVATLEQLSDADLLGLVDKSGIQLPIFKIALAELIKSGKQNLAKELENRTAQSQAQSNAYTYITKGIAYNAETNELYVRGFSHSKTVLVEGNYPKVNSRPKTIAKRLIQKEFTKMAKFRNLTLPNASTIISNGGIFPTKG